MRQTQILLHSQGPALWPEHKDLAEVLSLQATTPVSIFEATYQGNPTPPEGSIFMRQWWAGKNRFDPDEPRLANWVVARWLSWDTGLKDKEDNAYTSMVCGELWPNYLMAIREVWRSRVTFPDLPAVMLDFARHYNKDGKLRGVVIEDKASGTSAYQTLAATSEAWLVKVLVPFMPSGDKDTRAQQAAVWCKNDCVLLPRPTESVSWLADFTDELFDFPGSAYKDQVDAFSQLILYTENIISEGWRARTGIQ